MDGRRMRVASQTLQDRDFPLSRSGGLSLFAVARSASPVRRLPVVPAAGRPSADGLSAPGLALIGRSLRLPLPRRSVMAAVSRSVTGRIASSCPGQPLRRPSVTLNRVPSGGAAEYGPPGGWRQRSPLGRGRAVECLTTSSTKLDRTSLTPGICRSRRMDTSA